LKFPGRRLLHQWTIVPGLALEDVLRPCQQVGLTGFAELRLGRAEALILYYMGSEVSAVCREGAVVHHGTAALGQLRALIADGDGNVAIYELPLDMAHLLRGLSKRRRQPDPLQSRADLAAALDKLGAAGHTGTCEVQTKTGGAMLLLVNGRVSNTYWEPATGSTLEKDRARAALDQALDTEVGQLYTAEFSRVAWRSRQDVEASVPTHFIPPAEKPSAETLAAEETRERHQVLDDLESQLPAVTQVFVFDLLTGAVLAQRSKGAAALRASLVAVKLPVIATQLRLLVQAEPGDELELLELSTSHADVVMAAVPEVQEAIGLVADKAQPTAHVRAVLVRVARSYAARCRESRQGLAAAGR
jgi:hypothetical protein